MRLPRMESPGCWWKAARGWRPRSSRPGSSMKSGCYEVLIRSAPTGSRPWMHCRSPFSPARLHSSHVLAGRCKRTPLRFLNEVLKFVMPGLVPGIHVLAANDREDVDGRDKPGHDGKGAE